MTSTVESRQQRRARERDAAKAARASTPSTPSPYGPRDQRRSRHRAPRPAPLAPEHPRLLSTTSRPRRLHQFGPDETNPQATRYGHALLVGLGQLTPAGRNARHVYGGTVPWPTVRDRRQRNRLARAARKATR